jgi:hypothetical protein
VVEAAVRAVRAGERASWGFGRGPSAAEVLEARLGPFDWSRFGSPGYALLREVHRRVSEWSGPTGGRPDGVEAAGAKYEDATLPARARLSRAMSAA